MSKTKHAAGNPLLRFTGLPIVAVLGVVYADIGTSPLYAINELANHNALQSDEAIFGAISLVFWAVTFITFKYLLLVLRADHEREGGVFSLLNILKSDKTRYARFLVIALVLGAGLLLAEGTLTPAISVLSAVEGTSLITESFSHFVVPITLGILFGLFLIQRKGTHKIGALFGPIMITWFTTIGLLGARQILAQPDIVAAINPVNILYFLRSVSLHEALIVLGFVVLVITGGEALYADMGHFGRKPIQAGWFALVYPALILSYLGQGAFLLSENEVAKNNLFFSMVPAPLLPFIVILATLATIIASQALITGAYSLAIQAIELKLMPRVRSLNTNALHKGQIYVPFVNWSLMIGTMLLVVIFHSSTRLASAYGLSVASVMLLTSLSMIRVAQIRWGWSKLLSISVFGIFVISDGIFWFANTLKFPEGGYIPMALGCCIFTLMMTWRWGRHKIFKSQKAHRAYGTTFKSFLNQMGKVQDVDCSFVSLVDTMNMEDKNIPLSLEEYKNNHNSYPRHILFLHFSESSHAPYVNHEDAIAVSRLVESTHETGGTVDFVAVKYGFMQEPNLEKVLMQLHKGRRTQLRGKPEKWAVSIVHEHLVPANDAKRTTRWRALLFNFMRQNASSSYSFFTTQASQSRLWNTIQNIRVH